MCKIQKVGECGKTKGRAWCVRQSGSAVVSSTAPDPQKYWTLLALREDGMGCWSAGVALCAVRAFF